ncbi:MAG: glycosyltransferase family 39 protein [bacterium]
MTEAPGTGNARFLAFLAVALGVALLFRFAWPLADPPEAMSWSSGSFTDPPSNVLAARYAVQGGPGRAIEVPERLLYPALDFLARIAYRTLGVRRLATVALAALLGTLSVALLSLALRRGAGERAAAAGAVLAAVSSWLVPNSRILMPESVALFFVLLASCLAISRSPAEWMAAGAAAAAGGLLGKYHALAFLPALWVFLGARSGRRAVVASAAGAAAIGVAWVGSILLPHHAEIARWVRHSSVGLGGGVSLLPAGGLAAPFIALDQSWMIPVMPIVSAIGAWHIWRTLGSRDAWRRRLDDGSALFVLWAAFSFVATAYLPYRAPRYFTLVAAPLVACAAAQIAALLGESPAPRSRPFAGPALFAWIWFALFAVLNAAVRLEAAFRRRFLLLEWLRDPNAPATFSKLYGILGSIPRQAVQSGIAALIVTAIVLARRRGGGSARARAAGLAERRFAWALVAVALAWDVGIWGAWALGRSTTIEDAKHSLQALLPADAVVLGGFAPLLTEGTSIVAVPQFGGFDASFLDRTPRPTHLALLDADVSALVRVAPSVVKGLVQIERWPMRTTWAKSVALYRLPPSELPAGYRPSTFEQARDAVESGDTAQALALIAEQRRTRGETSDLLLLEARCRVDQEDLAGAEKLYWIATAQRPRDTLPLRNLGALAVARGDSLAALKLWTKALSLDTNDADMADLLAAFLRR